MPFNLLFNLTNRDVSFMDEKFEKLTKTYGPQTAVKVPRIMIIGGC